MPAVNNLRTLTRSPTVAELTASGGIVTLFMTIASTHTAPTKVDKFVETFVTGTATYVTGSTKLNDVAASDPTIGRSSEGAWPALLLLAWAIQRRRVRQRRDRTHAISG